MNHRYEMYLGGKMFKEGTASVPVEDYSGYIISYLLKDISYRKLNGVKIYVDDFLVYDDEVKSGKKTIQLTRKPIIKKLQGRPHLGDGAKSKQLTSEA